MKKKLFSLFLTAILTVSVGIPTALAQEAAPEYAEHMVFQVASTNINESVDYNADALSKYFEDMFNFEWDIISLPSENDEEKIRVWINAGNMPEVVIGGSYKSGEMMNYIDQGLLYRFPDDWKDRWPNAAKAFELTSLGDAVAEQAGGTYIFPRAIFASNYPAEKVVPHYLVYLRKDWAEAVGFPLKDAYKTSELMEYARLIKEKDPGNVGSRLVPMAIRPGFNCYTFTLPNSAYSGGADTSCEFYVGEDGQYRWGPASEATLTGLKLYKQAYDEGLLHPEFYAYTGQEAEEDFYIAGIAGMTVQFGMASYMALTENYLRENLGLEYDDVVHTALILGEDGAYHAPELINYAGYVMFSPNISEEKFCRYMDLMDYAATDYGQMVIRMGFEGVDWNYGEQGEILSLYAEGDSARSKYPSIYPIYHRLVIMSDDFTLINPAYRQQYRDRVAKMYTLKNEYATDESIAPIDWNVQLHSSDAMSRISINFGDEYATVVLSSGNIEDNWNNWVKSYAYLIDPVLQELNDSYANQ